jgi:NAD(P)-dependent dehydrogenase (short-subunit alcohol dehydrogenase family)
MKQNMFDEESNSLEEWTESYRTNVASTYFLTTACLPLLQRSTEMQNGYSGCVINITSISGLVRISQHHPADHVSKAAAVHLSNMLGAEIVDAGLKIRTKNIAPGEIPRASLPPATTDILTTGVYPSEMTTGESGEDQKSHIPKAKFEGKVPANRPGSERDIASAGIFVATNQYLN